MSVPHSVPRGFSQLRQVLPRDLLASVVVFLCMSTLIKAAGKDIPAGQITFLRSAFAMVPILAFLAMHGQLRDAFRTNATTTPHWLVIDDRRRRGDDRHWETLTRAGGVAGATRRRMPSADSALVVA